RRKWSIPNPVHEVGDENPPSFLEPGWVEKLDAAMIPRRRWLLGRSGLRPMSADRFAQAAVDRLDEIAHAMERKWGIDRLPKLVDPALAARFAAQAEKLNAALRSERPDAMAAQAAAMERAWKALDAAAIAAGHEPLAPMVWETVIPSTGEIVAIVRTSEEASTIARERNGSVYTLAEVAV